MDILLILYTLIVKALRWIYVLDPVRVLGIVQLDIVGFLGTSSKETPPTPTIPAEAPEGLRGFLSILIYETIP